MAPNAKPSQSQSSDDLRTTMSSPTAVVEERNITYGVNYSIPSVEAFVPFGLRRASDCVETSGKDTTTRMSDTADNSHNVKTEIDKGRTVTISDDAPHVRKSSRQPKPRRKYSNPTQFDKSRVRYDINLVPMVRKNPEFQTYWRDRWDNKNHNNSNNNNMDHETDHKKRVTRKCNSSNKENDDCHSAASLTRPFEDSVLWIPSSRSEWEDCLSEMTALCKSASVRRRALESQLQPPYYAKPLSRDYIRDRVDIDDPLIGYQFRHEAGGWLQGFLLFTNFTTWSHYFKWDSTHAASGVPADKNRDKIDADGSLAQALEHEPRSGDPLAGGVVFSSIAEISLVGGLKCGEYLLRMALDDIRARDQYRYVVLQATDSSRTFYEKFGFTRVGAISRYAGRKSAVELSDIVGYRHWTYAHESEQSLGMHGGPSYMMALKIEEPTKLSFLETMKQFAVSEKPRVKQLGAAQTPATKKAMISVMSPLEFPIPSVPSLVVVKPTPAKRGPGRPRKRPLDPPPKRPLDPPPKRGPGRPRKRPLSLPKRPPPRKHYQFMQQRTQLLAPPPPGKGLTYAQKQYQSVWLAVPPKSETTSRRPPRERR